MFVDSHAHLDGERFDADRDEVLARARDCSGSANIVAIGTGDGPGHAGLRREDWQRSMRVVYATIGIHPHEAKLANRRGFRGN
jgi:TatD DNase family protein